MPGEHLVATLGQIPPGCMKRVEVEGEGVVLFNCDGKVFAALDVCPHKGAPLSAGDFDDGVVMCPLHAWEFDVRTGECLSLPEWPSTLRQLAVRVDDGRVFVGSLPISPT
jgi:nitrite reductase/ring-hydroxylating ferredoxin subunit